jgi:hypothetical protein
VYYTHEFPLAFMTPLSIYCSLQPLPPKLVLLDLLDLIVTRSKRRKSLDLKESVLN